MPGVEPTVSLWTDVSLTSTCTDLSDGLVSCQRESRRQWYASSSLHLPPNGFHVNYSGGLSDFLWVWKECEAALLKHLQKCITLPLMNLAANWQGAAKKCELSVGNTLHTKETQHTGWPAISLYNNVFKFGFDFDVYLKNSPRNWECCVQHLVLKCTERLILMKFRV